MLDETLQINPLNLLDLALTRLSVKIQEQHDGRERTGESSGFVIDAPFVAHVTLEMFLGGNLDAGEFLEDAVN